ncbi:hypothetical protein SEVIR_9G233242v4 [Setaria viridis]
MVCLTIGFLLGVVLQYMIELGADGTDRPQEALVGGVGRTMQFPPPNLHDLRQAGIRGFNGASSSQQQGRRSCHGRRRNVSEGMSLNPIISRQEQTRSKSQTKLNLAEKVWKPISTLKESIGQVDAREPHGDSVDPMPGEVSSMGGVMTEHYSPSDGNKLYYSSSELQGGAKTATKVRCTRPIGVQTKEDSKWAHDRTESNFEYSKTDMDSIGGQQGRGMVIHQSALHFAGQGRVKVKNTE